MLSGFWNLLKATALEWWNDNAFRLSAALAFYMIFSLSPLLLIAIAVAGLFFGQEQARTGIADEIGTLAGEEARAAVTEVSGRAEIAMGSPMAIAVGIVTLVIGSTVVFAELQNALNQVWDVKADPKRSGLWKLARDRLLSFGLVLAVAFLLLVSLVISTGLTAAHNYLTEHLPQVSWIWRVASFGVSILVVTLLFALIYRYLPDVAIQWRDVAIGALVTSVLFNLGKFLIGLYLGQMTISSTYGLAGSFGVFLIWVYYSALICFFGAEFTQVFARRHGKRIQPSRHAVRIGHKPNQAPLREV